MIEIIVDVVWFVAGAAGFAALRALSNRREQDSQKALAGSNSEKTDTSLFGILGGVYIREPNGSAHRIQTLTEKELAERGMVLFDLRRDAAENLIKDGVWDPSIATQRIKVAIVGRILTRRFEEQEVKYVTVRHIHTESGRHFHNLPPDHPDFRGSNLESHLYYFDNHREFSPSRSGDHINWYEEPEAEYMRRREKEKKVNPVPVEEFSLDVRFYGPDGAKYGGCCDTAPTDTKDPIGFLVTKLTSELAGIRRSLNAHSMSLAAHEIDPNMLPKES